MTAVTLPPLAWRPSRNYSLRRLPQGVTPYLVCVHRPVGKYGPSIEWLRNPKSQASAHVITEGNRTGVDVATQLVAWDRKAWACELYNSVTYNIEVDDNAWDGSDPGAFERAARLVAFVCHKAKLPAVWAKDPHWNGGIIRHLDLGAAGGGHTDPTSDLRLWRRFVKECELELLHGGFRRTYGRGLIVRARVP